MNRLIVMRHAEAAGASPRGGDRERPLTEAGREAARAMGRLLSRRGFAPDAACVSPATRARQTWEAASESFGDVDLDCRQNLYNADADVLRRALQAAEGHCGTLMMVAHNPGVQQLALDLLSEGAAPPSILDRFQRGFPVGAAAAFVVDPVGRCVFEAFWTPDDAREMEAA